MNFSPDDKKALVDLFELLLEWELASACELRIKLAQYPIFNRLPNSSIDIKANLAHRFE